MQHFVTTIPYRRLCRYVCTGSIALLMLSGCTISQPATWPAPVVAAPFPASNPPVPPDSMDVHADSAGGFLSAASLERSLRAQPEGWAGTPHEWGGTSRDGIDCSALVQTLYRELLNTELPRTTRGQSKLGRRIAASRLQPGDLVFYRIDARTRHVGIFVGNNEFLHASKSEGVTISSLKAPYWRHRFWMARRVLEPAPWLPGGTPDDGSISW